MKRRDFLGAAAGAIALPGVVTAARAADAIEWRMATCWPKGAPGVGVNAQRLADRIGAMSGGRLRVKLYGADEIVPPFEVFDAVSRGVCEMGHGTPYYWQGKNPAFHYFTGVPFGLTAPETAGWLAHGGGQALWDEAYAPFGVLPFYAGSSGVQAGGWFKREIKTLDDLKGLSFRIAGLGGEVMRRLGTTVVLTPPGEIFTSMKTGTIDAAEWVGPWNDIAFGLNKVAKYYYLPAFHEAGPSLELMVSKEKFETLPDDLKEIVHGAALASAAETLADFTFHNIEAFAQLVAAGGTELREWPEPVAAAMAGASQEVLAELAGSSDLAGRIALSYRDYLAKAREWSKWSDAAMLKLRNSHPAG
ncbi:MAG: TRAP transporter substrate-binding protein [Alphaproteobacteria bacterium]